MKKKEIIKIEQVEEKIIFQNYNNFKNNRIFAKNGLWKN